MSQALRSFERTRYARRDKKNCYGQQSKGLSQKATYKLMCKIFDKKNCLRFCHGQKLNEL